MSKRLNLPVYAEVDADGRMHAASAERNAGAICDLVAAHAPGAGTALELASGTGQHTVALARRLPQLAWQPSDVDAGRRASVDAWARAEGLVNIAPAIEVDATSPGWAALNGGKALILLANLLHLVSQAEARTLIAETAQALAPGGIFILYGPFLRDGETTSDGDTAFHASLRQQDPEIGYKDDWDVIDWLHGAFLDLVQVVEMPSNNLAFVSRRPA